MSTSRVKRQYHSLLGTLPGPFTQANSSDPYIQEIANAALFEIDWRSNSYSRQKILRIVSAQMQVCPLLICIVAVVYCFVYYSKIPLIHYSRYLTLEAGILQTGNLHVHYIQCAY